MRSTTKNPILKVVILGDSSVGKTCLLARFVSNMFDEHSISSLGVGFFKKDVEVDDQTYTLQIWDTAGQERFKALRAPFYRGTDICILTYALNDKTSFKNLDTWRKEFIDHTDFVESNEIPFVVVGNKSDVPVGQRKVSQFEVETWCDENGMIPYIETSAKNASNVQEAFELGVQYWLRFNSRPDLSQTIDDEIINLPQKQSRSKISCCSSRRNGGMRK